MRYVFVVVALIGSGGCVSTMKAKLAEVSGCHPSQLRVISGHEMQPGKAIVRGCGSDYECELKMGDDPAGDKAECTRLRASPTTTSGRRAVDVPRTEAGVACVKTCLSGLDRCLASSNIPTAFGAGRCDHFREACTADCPGATYEDGTPAKGSDFTRR